MFSPRFCDRPTIVDSDETPDFLPGAHFTTHRPSQDCLVVPLLGAEDSYLVGLQVISAAVDALRVVAVDANLRGGLVGVVVHMVNFIGLLLIRDSMSWVKSPREYFTVVIALLRSGVAAAVPKSPRSPKIRLMSLESR